MNLIESVKLFFAPDIAATDTRIQLSEKAIQGNKVNAINYSESSFIPSPNWRLCTQFELKKLLTVTTETRNNYDTVSIIKLPVETVEPICSVLDDNNYTLSSVRKNQKYHSAIRSIKNFVLSNLSLKKHMTVHGLYEGLSNQQTVTIDPTIGKYIGMHFDNWDELSLDKRQLSSNRVCVNLGRQTRYLLLVNLTLKDIYQRLEKLISPDLAPKIQKFPGILRDLYFNSEFSNYPIIKIAIMPGEAYIAPTENILHDGCTIGTTSPDLSFTIRGYLKLNL